MKIWGVIPRVGSPNFPLEFDKYLEDPKIELWEPLGGYHIQNLKANDPISCMGS